VRVGWARSALAIAHIEDGAELAVDQRILAAGLPADLVLPDELSKLRLVRDGIGRPGKH
jgi:hypothetical protein